MSSSVSGSVSSGIRCPGRGESRMTIECVSGESSSLSFALSVTVMPMRQISCIVYFTKGLEYWSDSTRSITFFSLAPLDAAHPSDCFDIEGRAFACLGSAGKSAAFRMSLVFGAGLDTEVPSLLCLSAAPAAFPFALDAAFLLDTVVDSFTPAAERGVDLVLSDCPLSATGVSAGVPAVRCFAASFLFFFFLFKALSSFAPDAVPPGCMPAAAA
mmetsp:Transcript_8785/g.11183  ORF Transcript_8785/g.11183 Transcript_8785/m.11183 type:complete len:214 (-) Transcript_8785:1576-2217(-)